MALRRGGVTDIPWFFARLEIKRLISHQHFTRVVNMAWRYHCLEETKKKCVISAKYNFNNFSATDPFVL